MIISFLSTQKSVNLEISVFKRIVYNFIENTMDELF